MKGPADTHLRSTEMDVPAAVAAGAGENAGAAFMAVPQKQTGRLGYRLQRAPRVAAGPARLSAWS